jgi:hypothetical protein
MMQSRIVIAAAAAAVGVLFTAPAVTNAMPLTPIGPEAQVSTIVKESNGIDQVAKRYYKKKRYAYRNRYKRNRYARCWNCGYRRHYRYRSPFYFSYGYPYYPYGYPYYGPSFGFGIRIN